MFIDTYNREISYVRLSLTDRCNFRCVYCMPEGPIDWFAKKELLSVEEIGLMSGVLASHGIKRIRLTGGEPLLRNDIAEVVTVIRDAGISSIALTTNAFLLPKHADNLKRAGVDQLNVSLDSLRPERFAKITRNGSLDRVLAGIEAARNAGFERIKFNAVVVGGFNDDELVDLVRFAGLNADTMRFIEFMPIGQRQLFTGQTNTHISANEMRRRLSESMDLIPDAGVYGLGPARYFQAEGNPVGFISAVTNCFCASCNRIRISATGAVRACLADDVEFSIRDAMRSAVVAGIDPTQAIESVINTALLGKKETHDFGQIGGETRTLMHAIGG